MAEWNRVRIIPHPVPPSSILWTDALGSFGCGAICLTLTKWIQLHWDDHKGSLNRGVDGITWMELLPIILAYTV